MMVDGGSSIVSVRNVGYGGEGELPVVFLTELGGYLWTRCANAKVMWVVYVILGVSVTLIVVS
jgi:hypothetical protein